MTSDNQPVPERVPADDDVTAAIHAEHESIPQDTRQRVLERDSTCQVNGCRAPDIPGAPGLLVQRITNDPAHCDSDDPANLVARCPRCARWIAQMPSRADLPAVLQERLNGIDLKSSRVEILRYLFDEGPASTGEITDHVSGLSSTVSVRRALYDLMSLDVRSPGVEGRLVAKDRIAKQYDMPWAVDDDHEARGSVPVRPAARQTRVLDALVARLLKKLEGNVEDPRELVATVVNRDVTQTYHMQRRAQAFQFPLAQWVEPNRSLPNDLAAVEAVDVLAQTTENISHRRVAAPLADLLERDDEQQLATSLRQQYLPGDYQSSNSTDSTDREEHHSQEQEQSQDLESEPATESDQTAPTEANQDLHVFGSSDTSSDSRPHDEDGYYPTEDDYAR